MNRTEASRCLAKICAYLNCGQTEKAKEWREKLDCLLNDAMPPEDFGMSCPEDFDLANRETR